MSEPSSSAAAFAARQGLADFLIAGVAAGYGEEFDPEVHMHEMPPLGGSVAVTVTLKQPKDGWPVPEQEEKIDESD